MSCCFWTPILVKEASDDKGGYLVDSFRCEALHHMQQLNKSTIGSGPRIFLCSALSPAFVAAADMEGISGGRLVSEIS
jgi:hypothetical protein